MITNHLLCRANKMAVCLLILKLFCVLPCLINAHIPVNNYDEWAEPNIGEYEQAPTKRLERTVSLDRLTALRTVMATNNIDAYIVPTGDAHNSQYIAPSDARREWISGLSGSSGTVLVTADQALLWTDGRYFTQFFMQVDTELWELMRQGTNVTINQWLSTLRPGSVVGVDPTTYTRSAWNTLQSVLTPLGISLVAPSDNLVDRARTNLGDPASARPNNPLIPLSVSFTGRVASAKIAELISQINARGASALVLTALDDIAYTLNIRGSDIPYNPVFFSYLVVRADITTNNVILFWGNGVLPIAIVQQLTAEGVTVQPRPYSDTFEYLRKYTSSLPAGSTVWLSHDASHAIYTAVEDEGRINTLSTLSPVALMKCIKNDVELQGFRNAHIKDGIAVVRFLRWVHEEVAAGRNVTEIDVSDRLEELRSQEADAMGPSFATIAGAGENGAIIHYKPIRGESRLITATDVLLVDSGGQYRDGTTDITRTRHMGVPTGAQRLAFTRVLKGQILMGTAVFPRGSTGHVLDTLARKSLWDVGLNYEHGTGHGVGHYLNVHEGPSGIGSGQAASDPGIQPRMIFSNEPGYYEVGEYGIRHEDLVEVIEMTRESDHIFADGLVGDFNGRGAVGFFTISLVPHQTSFLNVSLLNEHDIKYLNDYHARVLATLGPILQARNLTEDYDWLVKECAPISNAAILLSATPLLLFAALSLWWF